MNFREIKEILKSNDFWNGAAKGSFLAWMAILSSILFGVCFGLGFHMSITILENLS